VVRGLSVGHDSERAKMDKPIVDVVWGQTQVDPKNHVLDGISHWQHLSNTYERPMRGGDAAFS